MSISCQGEPHQYENWHSLCSVLARTCGLKEMPRTTRGSFFALKPKRLSCLSKELLWRRNAPVPVRTQMFMCVPPQIQDPLSETTCWTLLEANSEKDGNRTTGYLWLLLYCCSYFKFWIWSHNWLTFHSDAYILGVCAQITVATSRAVSILATATEWTSPSAAVINLQSLTTSTQTHTMASTWAVQPAPLPQVFG